MWQMTDCLLLAGLDGFYKPLHLHFTLLREFTPPVLTIHRQPPGCPSVLGVQKNPVSLILSWSGQRLRVHNAILSAFTTGAMYSIWHRRHCHRREKSTGFFRCFRFCLFRVYLHACRIGEASNPGPDTPIRFAVLNPTSLSDKTPLLREIGADILCLSETSCTAATQREEQRLLKDDLGFAVQWGCPVPPHSETSKGDNARRGQPLGVAILSKFPTRPPRLPIEDPYYRSCRFQETWIKVHNINLCVIVIYAFTDAHPNSREKNRVLLSYALQRACQAGPFVAVTGDFNNALKNSPEGLHFRHHGFVDTLEWARWHFPSKIHPTCNGVSFNDTILASPGVFNLIDHAEVLSECAFANHLPFVLTLKAPPRTHITQKLIIPQDWTQLNVDTQASHATYLYKRDILHATFDSDSSVDHKLHQWALHVEDSICIRKDNHDANESELRNKALPRSFRGRCHGPKCVKIQTTGPPKPAGRHQFEPFSDVCTLTATHKTRQVRRIESFLRNLEAAISNTRTYELRDHLALEWKAICRAPGYPHSFSRWAITTVTSLWLVSPFSEGAVPWVRHLLAATRSDCQTYFRFAKDARTKNFQETLENDWKLFGGKFTCKLLKKAPHPPINQLMDVVQVTATRLRANGKDKPRLLLDHPICVSPSDFVSIEGCPTLVLKQDGLTLTVRDLPDHCPARCRIELELWVTAPPDVARLIEREWQPLWNRDTVEETQDLATWKHAINTIDRFGWHADAINASTRSIEPWKRALRRTRAHAAKGLCGFSQPEMLSLSDEAIDDLARVFQFIQDEQLWPEILIAARTVFLHKKATDLRPGNTRPITIFPLLFRLWGKVLSDAIMSVWEPRIPHLVAGAVPHKACSDIWWWIHSQCDLASQSDQVVFGFVQDLRKCYNCLPRLPICRLLIDFGVPPQLVSLWEQALTHFVRYFILGGDTFGPFSATTGIPEGDPVSVLAMLAFSILWNRAHTDQFTEAPTYADNLELFSRNFTSISNLFESNISFQLAWKQSIAWDKSWVWSNKPSGQKLWQQFLSHRNQSTNADDMPPIARVATELGAVINYTPLRFKGDQPARFVQASARLRSAKALPLSCSNAAKTVCSAVLPVALHGCEIMFPTNNQLSKLRTDIARVIIGPRSKTNPWLACCILCEQCLDPLFHCVVNIFRLVRRMMITDLALVSDVWVAALALQRHANGNRRMMRTGPRAALVRAATEMQFTLLPDFGVRTARSHLFNIAQRSAKQLKLHIRYAWDDLVMQRIFTTKRWQEVESVDSSTTALILNSLPGEEQAVLRNQLVGAFQSPDMYKHWKENDATTCAACGQEDICQLHTFLFCPATTAVREDWCDWLKDLSPADKQALILPSMPEIQASDDIWNILSQRATPQARFSIPREQPCVIYTDGSSNQARSHLERHVAWAIVRDHCTLDTQRVDYMQDWNRRNFALPPTFEVLQTGPVSLWQTVARAELTAILVSLCGANHAMVYSDSQYAVNLVNNILCQPDPKRYWKADNFDLVLAVCAIAPTCQAARICKIKAHQDLCAIPEPLAKYHAIGNTAANAARATGFLDTTELISGLQASAALARAKTRMTMQFCAQATLAFLRHSKDKEDSQHLNAQPTRCRLGMHITSTQAQALLWFCDPAYSKLDIPSLPHSEYEFAFWGVSYLSLLRNWLAALQWPSESQGDGSPDITWFELYLDFCIATQRNVPWNQGGTCDAPRYAMDPQPGYEIVPRPPLQQTLRNFASSVSHLATHLGARVLPTFCVEVKRCNSLTRAFAFEAAVGLSCRPQLVCPSIFQTTLSLYAHGNVSVRGHKSFGTYPVIPFVPPCVTIPEESVDVQFSASRKRAFKARERRRARTA